MRTLWTFSVCLLISFVAVNGAPVEPTVMLAESLGGGEDMLSQDGAFSDEDNLAVSSSFGVPQEALSEDLTLDSESLGDDGNTESLGEGEQKWLLDRRGLRRGMAIPPPAAEEDQDYISSESLPGSESRLEEEDTTLSALTADSLEDETEESLVDGSEGVGNEYDHRAALRGEPAEADEEDYVRRSLRSQSVEQASDELDTTYELPPQRSLSGRLVSLEDVDLTEDEDVASPVSVSDRASRSSRAIPSSQSSRAIPSTQSSRAIPSTQSSRVVPSEQSSRAIPSEHSPRAIPSEHSPRAIPSEHSPRTITRSQHDLGRPERRGGLERQHDEEIRRPMVEFPDHSFVRRNIIGSVAASLSILEPEKIVHVRLEENNHLDLLLEATAVAYVATRSVGHTPVRSIGQLDTELKNRITSVLGNAFQDHEASILEGLIGMILGRKSDLDPTEVHEAVQLLKEGVPKDAFMNLYTTMEDRYDREQEIIFGPEDVHRREEMILKLLRKSVFELHRAFNKALSNDAELHPTEIIRQREHGTKRAPEKNFHVGDHAKEVQRKLHVARKWGTDKAEQTYGGSSKEWEKAKRLMNQWQQLNQQKKYERRDTMTRSMRG